MGRWGSIERWTMFGIGNDQASNTLVYELPPVGRVFQIAQVAAQTGSRNFQSPASAGFEFARAEGPTRCPIVRSSRPYTDVYAAPTNVHWS